MVERAVGAAGDPFEGPAHAALERLDLGQRGARHRHDVGVAGAQMDADALEIVSPERAALAGRLPVRMEHEVVDDELRLAAEELAQLHLAGRPVEDIVLDPDPGEIAALGAERVARPRERLLVLQMLDALVEPFVARYDPVRGHRYLHSRSAAG